MKYEVEKVRRAVLAGDWGEDVWLDEPLSSHTSYRIGGPADIFAVAGHTDRLLELLNRVREEEIPHIVLGSGTNVLVADAGFRGMVIRNASRGIESVNGEMLRIRAGEMMRDAALQAIELGLGGLEWAIDIPGTVGGSVIGNAGAFGGYMGDVLRRAQLLTPEGEVLWVGPEELGLGYRTSRLKELKAEGRSCETVLSVEVLLTPTPAVLLRKTATEYTRRRQERQPPEPSAGSVFKRTIQYPAGFLIEQAGLKGERVGGAQVSVKHANFIVNLGDARATDVEALIDTCRERVIEMFGIELQLEIELVGEW